MGKHSLELKENLRPRGGSRSLLRFFIWSCVVGLVLLTAGSLYLFNLYKKLTPPGSEVTFGEIYKTLTNPGQAVFAGRDSV